MMSQNESNNEEPVDNVVQMPVRNMKKVLHQQHLLQKRGTILGSLVLFFGLFSFINHMIWQEGPNSTNSTRGLASVGNSISQSYDKEFESEMIAKLRNSTDVSFARQPSSIDQLNYGELKGAYRLKLKEGKIHSIQLSESIANADAKYQRSSLDFLLKHSSHLPIKYNRVDKIKQETADGLVKESFSLKWNQDLMGEVDFVHNEKGALVTFQVKE